MLDDLLTAQFAGAFLRFINTLKVTCNWRGELAGSFACSEAIAGRVLPTNPGLGHHETPLLQGFKRPLHAHAFYAFPAPGTPPGPRFPGFLLTSRHDLSGATSKR